MLRKRLLLIATLGLVVISAPIAKADLCFSYKKTGGGILVARGATLPVTNACQPLAMYEAGGLIGAATGSICQDGFGDITVLFHYTYDGCASNYFESGTCRLQLQRDGNLPTVSSTCRITTGNGVYYLEFDDGTLESCDGSQFALRVPNGGGAACRGGFSHRGPASLPGAAGETAQ